MPHGLRELLLQSLREASGTSGDSRVFSTQVREIGDSLGLTDSQILKALTSLSASGEIKLFWGGDVEVLTPKAVDASYYLENVGTFVGGNVGAAAVVGASAMGQGAIRTPNSRQQDQLAVVIVKLTALITLMNQSLSEIPLLGEDKETVAKAVKGAKGIVHELQTEQPNQANLKERLEEVDKGVGILSKIADLGLKISPHFSLVSLHHAIDAVHNALKLVGRQ